jgi:hypothetical protein
MTCGAISTHMVVCGFTFCEMLGLEQTKTRFRIFALAPAIGLLGVATNLPMWFPVVASAICFAMLPIAYLAILIMNNRRSYIGDAVGQGVGRMVYNILLVIALLVATVGSVIQINSRAVKPIRAMLSAAPAAPAVPAAPVTPPPADESESVPAAATNDGEAGTENAAPEAEPSP